MNRSFFALSVALVVLTPAHAQGVDLVRLRKAAMLPTVPIGADFGFSSRTVRLGDARDLPPQITRLEQELKTAPSDATRWQRLGMMFAESGEADRSKEAFQKAASVLEKALAGRPEDGRLQARLGECYQALGRLAEAEAVLRSATRLTPKEWRAWVALGELLDAKAGKLLALSPDELQVLQSVRSQAELKDKLQKLSPATLSEARRLSEQARQCYDRAVLSGTSEPEPYLARASARMLSEGGTSGLLAVLTAGKDSGGPETMKRVLAPEVVADLRKARRLATDSPETITATAAMECFWIVLEKGDEIEEVGTEASWKKLPQGAQAPVIEAMLRLSELTASPDKGIQAAACEGMGILAFLRGQTEKMESYLKRASGLRALTARSLDLLTLAYLTSGRFDSIVTLYQERIQTDDSPRNRFILAKALLKQGKKDGAQLQLSAALQSDPEDYLCSMGLAAFLLQENQPDATTPILTRLADLDRKGKLTTEQRAELLTLLGIWQALRGKLAEARETLIKAQKADPRSESTIEALASLG